MADKESGVRTPDIAVADSVVREDGCKHRRGGFDFWVGEVGRDRPIFTGRQQQPFICWTSESGLGQPLVDNHEGIGHPVFEIEGDPTSAVVGHSAKCGIPTRVEYLYLTNSGGIGFYDPANPPTDALQIPVGGQLVDFVIRLETGTLNRFIYTIAMLAPFAEDPAAPETLDNSAWNGNLVYYFGGGAGIGRWQGEEAWHSGLSSTEAAIFTQLLASGYAVATSSGTDSGVHYNMLLSSETVYMIKRHFAEIYGEPGYTIGLGGSGGAVQQYMAAQNLPGLLDAGIPVSSYPDMVTQTIHIFDCNLLEQYFLEDVLTYGPASKWATWSNRRWIEGLNASDTVINSLTGTPGSTECIEGWFTIAPVHLNPFSTAPEYLEVLDFYRYPQEVVDSIRWTHWNDLANIYGTDEEGFAPIPFDNVGVQYGLEALVEGSITTAEFLEINSCVGSWNEQPDFAPFLPSPTNLFDHDSMNRDPVACRMGVPSPRRKGNRWAMRAAYLSGHVFTGRRLGIPTIDLRPYLEDELDMHNSRQSFSVRQRLLNGTGHSDDLVIWFTGSEDDVPARVIDAVAVLHDYLTTGDKPASFVDACWDASGEPIAAGTDVWDGILDANPNGVCTQTYPHYASSRMVAGDGIAGDMFKCHLISIDDAIAAGYYGPVSFDAAERALLGAIFPDGVCDYSKPDKGKPRWLRRDRRAPWRR